MVKHTFGSWSFGAGVNRCISSITITEGALRAASRNKSFKRALTASIYIILTTAQYKMKNGWLSPNFGSVGLSLLPNTFDFTYITRPKIYSDSAQVYAFICLA